MSVFDIDQKGKEAQDEQARLNPLDLSQSAPGTFTGFFSGTGQGLAKGGARLGTAVAVAAPSVLEVFGTGLTKEGQDWYYRNVVDNLGFNAVDHWTADPAQVGTAGRITGGLAEMVLPLMAGGGNPALLGATESFEPSANLVRHGVDADTAAGVGLTQGASTLVGFKLPAAWGNNLTQRLITGAAGNLAVGTATQGAQQQMLASGGYAELAAAYTPWNFEARAVDTVMGLAFGGIAHVSARPVTSMERDAALTTNNAKHFQYDTAPGVPANDASSAAHQNALSSAIAQALRGEPVDVAATIKAADFVPHQRAPSTSTEGLRGGDVAADVQADFESLGKRHGFETTSTTRSAAENKRVRGVENSQHLEGRGTARDWSVKGKSAAEVEAFVADLRAAGFEVITKPHGTGPHIHAELPRGGRRMVRDPVDALTREGPEPPAMRPEPTPPADVPALSRQDAESLLDQRLSTLDEMATTGRLRDEEIAALQIEDVALAQVLELQDTGAVAAGDARARLAPDEQVRIEERRAEIQKAIQDSRAATGFERVATQLRERIASAPDDAAVIQLAERVTGRRPRAEPAERSSLPDTGTTPPMGATGRAKPRTAQQMRDAPDWLAPGAMETPRPAAARTDAPAADAGPARAQGGDATPADAIDGDVTGQAAAEAVATVPDLQVTLDDGTTVSAAEALARADADIAQAQVDANAFQAAVACTLRFL